MDGMKQKSGEEEVVEDSLGGMKLESGEGHGRSELVGSLLVRSSLPGSSLVRSCHSNS